MKAPECRIAGCGQPVHQGRNFRRTVCGSHHDRKCRTGSYLEDVPIVPHGEWRTDEPSYLTVHKRVHARRGKASEHLCVDCGSPAQEWSYDHDGGDNERREVRPFMGERELILAYSLDINDYSPRCLSCHRVKDSTSKKEVV